MRADFGKVVPLAAVLVLAGCDIEQLTGSARFKEDFHYNYRLKPGGRLSVENLNGSIAVHSWDQDEVEITGTKYASSQALLDALKIDVAATDDFIQIRTVRPSGRRGNMGAKFVIRVPGRVELNRITSSNGSIDVEGIEGGARLRTSNGKIRVADLKGDLEVSTSNGSVTLTNTRGSAVIKTSNGSIRTDGVHGHFEAHTSNGSIRAQIFGDGDGRPIEIHTSNGSIDLTLMEQPSADVIVTSSNSMITVHAPASLAAQLKAETTNAPVHTDFEVTIKGSRKKTRLEGTINGGGPLIRLETSNGTIRLLKL